MTHLLRSLIVVTAFGGALAACGNGNGSSTPPAPVVVPPAPKIEDQFGSCFATRFRADANTKATDPVPCDLAPPSLTVKPLVF